MQPEKNALAQFQKPALTELRNAGKKQATAQRKLDEAKEASKAAAMAAADAGIFEVTIADELGVDRMTVRRWLGKRTSRDHRGNG